MDISRFYSSFNRKHEYFETLFLLHHKRRVYKKLVRKYSVANDISQNAVALVAMELRSI
ncbi:MAG: hypothetical protein GY750_20380 [Lentisphaerae bacterium]|nr:hypothetical protein [Lentisphaerota bacterium]MCP4103752.1 hypothetical protein [Lentisphaerota bacterium]